MAIEKIVSRTTLQQYKTKYINTFTSLNRSPPLDLIKPGQNGKTMKLEREILRRENCVHCPLFPSLYFIAYSDHVPCRHTLKDPFVLVKFIHT